MPELIIDADTHINEPPDLWLTRTPVAMREAVPHVNKNPEGFAWVMDGNDYFISPIVNAVGRSPLDWWVTTEAGYDDPTFRVGAWDPCARLADMDLDGVEVHVLFPTYALRGGCVFSKGDRELRLACVRAYNDWLSEFASHDPDRLVGVAVLPDTNVEDAVDEVTRVRQLPGLRGVLLTAWPNGSTTKPHHDDDDRFWSCLEETELPAVIHVGFAGGGEVTAEDGVDELPALAEFNHERQAVNVIPTLSHFLLSGILERHPKMRLGVAEVGIGWVPYFLEQTEDNFNRHRFWTQTRLSLRPSEYWRRQCFATFQIDTYGVDNRSRVGIDTICWSSDYPHSGADWPNSNRTINEQLHGVDAEDRGRILSANAARLFGVDLDARRARQSIPTPARG